MSTIGKNFEITTDAEDETFLEDEAFSEDNNDLSQSRQRKESRTRCITALICTLVVMSIISFVYKSNDKKASNFIPEDLYSSNVHSNTASISNVMTPEVEDDDEAEEAMSSLGPDMDIFPRKLYNVIGLESSGTQFVTRVITKALGLPKYREGSFPNKVVEMYDTQVVHYSLPWGSTCGQHATVPTVDIVLPSQCTRDNSKSECNALVKEAWGLKKEGKVVYPQRYNLDIISNKEFYEKHNVEVFNIIAVRDPTISFEARKQAHHCNIEIRAKKEEEAGTAIIIDAINKYILENDKSRLVTKDTYPLWHANKFNRNRHLRVSNTGLPSGQNVVLVSYESLMKLQGVYVELLYKALGIESNYLPDVKDGNAKYIHD